MEKKENSVTIIQNSLMAGSSELPLKPFGTITYYGSRVEECTISNVPMVRLLLLTSSKESILLITADLCSFSVPLVTKLMETVSSKTGIPKEAILFSANHPHSSYSMKGFKIDEFCSAIADKILIMFRYVTPVAEVRLRQESLPDNVLLNRRFKFPASEYGAACIMFNEDAKIDSKGLEVSDQLTRLLKDLGSNPAAAGLQQKNHITSAKCDPRLTLYALYNEQQNAIGAFLRFSAHPVINTMLFSGNVISSDFIHYTNRALKQKLGCPVLMFNGALGDVRPLNSEYSFAESERIGNLLSQIVMRGAEKKIAPETVKLSYIMKEISLRKGTPGNLVEVERSLEKYHANYKSTSDPVQRKKIFDMCEFLKFIRNSLVKTPGIWTDENLKKGSIPVRVRLLNLPGLNLLFLPGEPFVELAIELEKITGAHVVGLTDQYIGYLPSLEDYKMGGYETSDAALDEKGIEELYQLVRTLVHV
jgi:hypothetical protein